MVAYTSPDCLPYFECDDSPCLNTGTVCEPSTVFCDLTALLETRLNSFDNTVARTGTAIPMFKVARNAQQTIDTTVANADLRIIWDTVLVDNENMVDLDVDTHAVTVERPGLWQFELYLWGTPPQTTGNIFDTAINSGQGSGSFYVDCQTMWRAGQFAYSRLAYQRELTVANLAIIPFTVGAIAGFQGTTGTGLVVVEYAELSGWWNAEEVP